MMEVFIVAEQREDQVSSQLQKGRVRVLIVGTGGRTAALEQDPSASVHRVQGLLEAIAEVTAEPAARHAWVVALSPGAWTLPALKEFTQALRLVDARAWVIHIGPCEPGARDLIDGVVSQNMQPEEIRAIIESRQPGAMASPVEVLPGPGAPSAGVGDGLLVHAVMLGQDLPRQAIQLVRVRLHEEDVHFVAEGSAPEPDEVRSSEVLVNDHAVGRLIAPLSIGQADLDIQAQWLGAWLTLDRRFRDLRIESLTDPLTGAWNRRYFDRYLANAIEQAKASRLTVTVLVFDIDEFKQFNDRFSHAAGDEILIETVRMMRSVVRPSDRVCRIGGDEFAVIFYEPRGPRVPSSKPPESIYRIARRFQSQIQGTRFPKLGDQAPDTLTISGGLATYPWDGQDPKTLLERADQLAMESKASGKNVITLGPGAKRECVDPEDE